MNSALDLLTKHRRKFLNFVRTSVHDLDDSEEIIQRASVKVIARSQTLRDSSKAAAWIYRLLRNEIADHFRRMAIHLKKMEPLPQEISSGASLPASAQPRRTCPCMLDEITKLKNNYSDALQSLEMRDESVTSYTARKGISENNAMVSLHRARKSLRKRLESRCAACAGAGCFDCTCKS